ncbi:MAG: STAS domain-containing protein [Phycisphaerae bacterium]|nr:STAS domain-containing protein [Phycisphaerae bacterium]
MDNTTDLQITASGDVAVVSFGTAAIDAFSGIDEMIERLRAYIGTEKPKKMVVDFAGVRFFTSQMLGVLVDVWRRLRDYGGRLLICGINPQLNRVFRITNLDRIFEFYPDRDAAVSALSDL